MLWAIQTADGGSVAPSGRTIVHSHGSRETSMHLAMLRAYTTVSAWRVTTTDKLRDERGEGIISVAIAVLIMAALGVVAYGAFDILFNNTTDAAEQQINGIGG